MSTLPSSATSRSITREDILNLRDFAMREDAEAAERYVIEHGLGGGAADPFPVVIVRLCSLALKGLELEQSALVSETPKQMPCIEVGAYTVGPRRDGSFWIEHESGEGMHIRAELLAEAIHAFYKEHF